MSLEYGKMDFAVSFSPLTAFPLDARSYFESYSAAEAAAAGAVEVGTLGSKYYFGETVCVVENGAANMYIINPDGTLGEVGGKIEVDEKAFELVDGVLNLLGFADAVAGAQPVKNSDGTIVWIKPDTTTVEGLTTSVTALEKSVETIQSDLDAVEAAAEDLTGRVEAIEADMPGLKSDVSGLKTGAETLKGRVDGIDSSISGINVSLGQKANAADVYTKEETDLAIESAVVAADHLRRKIVDSIDAINKDADDALLYIYMVPTGTQYNDDKYDEYIVIEAEDGARAIEKVGSWEVDLSDYVTTAVLNAGLDTKVSKVDGYGLISDAGLEKLGAIESGAQVNKIESVAADFKIENKELQLVSVAASKLSGLADHSVITDIKNDITGINLALADKAASSEVEAVDGKVDGALERVAANEQAIEGINSALKSKVESSVVEQLDRDLDAAVLRIDGIDNAIAGINTSLGNKAEKSVVDTLQTSFNSLNDRVTQNTSDISLNTTEIGNVKTSVTNIESALNNYVTTKQHTADILAIKEMLKWTTI